jgi:alpha-tubulin suppressor-like RCC1 family protein
MRLTARAVFRVMRLVVAVALLAPVTAAVAQTAAGGAGFTIVVKSDGSVWTFGQNNQGQLGDNTTTTRRTPLQVSGLSDIVAVAAGAYHALALESDGTLWA